MQADDEVVVVGTCPALIINGNGPVPPDARLLADRMATGCLIGEGGCPCPAEPWTYARCERVRYV